MVTQSLALIQGINSVCIERCRCARTHTYRRALRERERDTHTHTHTNKHTPNVHAYKLRREHAQHETKQPGKVTIEQSESCGRGRGYKLLLLLLRLLPRLLLLIVFLLLLLLLLFSSNPLIPPTGCITLLVYGSSLRGAQEVYINLPRRCK